MKFPRLYLRFYLALLASLLVFALGAAVLWHAHGAPAPRAETHFAMLTLLLLLAAAVALCALPVVRGIARRLERMRESAEKLATGDLTARAAVEGNDEVASLARSFNHAATRIEHLIGAHKLLLAQASHELRTPLTRIRLALDLIKDIDPERRRGLESDISELDDLIEEILLASRLDTVAQLETEEDVDLLALVAEECAYYTGVDLAGESVTVPGDPRLLRRLVRNLLENAQHHGRPPIRVELGRHADFAQLTVADDGPVIPVADQEHLFDPFYRRGNTHGHGLGLSLVRQIARKHSGEARYQGDDARASAFEVLLPMRVGNPAQESC